jgi:tryptophan synthase alpha chain
MTATSSVDAGQVSFAELKSTAATEGAGVRGAGAALPVVVGFGIRTPAAARGVATFADGVVVGSAAVEIVAKAVAAGKDPVPELSAFVRSLRDAMGSTE